MSDQELRCVTCGKPINKRKDLVVTNRLFTRFTTYHKDCYEKAFKNGDYTGRPVNTPAANIGLAVILLAALVLYFITHDLLVLLVLIFSPLYRLLVWYRFERRLKE